MAGDFSETFDASSYGNIPVDYSMSYNPAQYSSNLGGRDWGSVGYSNVDYSPGGDMDIGGPVNGATTQHDLSFGGNNSQSANDYAYQVHNLSQGSAPSRGIGYDVNREPETGKTVGRSGGSFGGGGGSVSTPSTRPTGGVMFDSGEHSGSGQGSYLDLLRSAIESDNSARKEARDRAMQDREDAISGQRSSASAKLAGTTDWRKNVDYLNSNPEVISDAVKNYILGRVFDRIDLDAASSESVLAQRYAQTGRAVNPSVLQSIRDKATLQKANQSRELEITSALSNRASRESATNQSAKLATYTGEVQGHEADSIGSYLENTNYMLPNNVGLLSTFAGRN